MTFFHLTTRVILKQDKAKNSEKIEKKKVEVEKDRKTALIN